MKKVDWVFWFSVSKREWFRRLWKSRGANCFDFQVLGYHISIGMPWHKEVIKKANINYPLEGVEHFTRVNEQNRKGVEKWGRFRYITT